MNSLITMSKQKRKIRPPQKRDEVKRSESIIATARHNEQVNRLIMANYDELKKTLVHTPSDNDNFNDTYLAMTFKFDRNSPLSFNEQFIRIFHKLRYAKDADARTISRINLNPNAIFTEQED